ncbi:MAG: bifunctional aspartate kinase/homoserine dehydrogenase I [Paludibacteraceae bacterium]|jgi:aspartokinase/homoserine dehydrogenase 1|nr:bifunctional aspartate kinase/homoserine dehydrogenase I [Paludibacteraceae bacterium]MDI9537365.1 bifunctional aspartate kinase/homoserine dehydrogenase I [Bacteroidota bacterium]HHT61939.1 bifunctional aspartate kinase/homoserine dehydrogenase I [Bacteroidales bacterium]MBP9039642.1 bifunctional aspartate kinase/homoserine dehydrogenase I [Paludibacteraceae bacterium]HOA46672.1 bifunctional aspartate kinase/homoserine dehydrogenase I [Paludibacteraceae bacterium]
MKVLKFGGSSITPEIVLNVKKIVESKKEPVVVVVSALTGITDKLYKVTELAAAGDSAYTEVLNEICSLHTDMVDALHLDTTTARTSVNKLLDELKNILQGVFLIKDISDRIADTIVGYGEQLSSIIVSRLIDGAIHVDSRTFIKTHTQFGRHVVDFELTNELITKQFENMPSVVVCGGFIASDKETGHTTNLGRGGSDYTAAILAAQLNASILEIWTDVDGFMTADPRIIKNAYVIEKLTFVEAMELSNFGAKVIYPPTIFPVFHKDIPIRIKNTMKPENEGTYISHEKVADGKKAIKGISSINDTALITIQGLGMVGVIGVNRRIFKAVAQHGISVFLVSQAASENTTSFAVKNADVELALEVLREEFKQEITNGEINHIKAEKDLATIAIVGENMKRTPGIAGKLFGALGRGGINVIACAQGASETNISFVTDLKSLRKALNVIHDSFFLSEYQELNVFLAGVGTVGGSLLEQIKHQQKKLMMEKGLKINVVGIANLDKALFNREGIDLQNYKKLLEEEGIDSSTENFKNEILLMNIFNSVLVDCTASPEIADIYRDMLANNISVVAANKIAASGDYDNYMNLKELARKRGVKYLFETNVGAGLPIMNTINNLTNSGDKILRMEAVLSGTLNFIFNTISAEIPFSKAVLMAKEARFAEPDPRIDLSGTDVIRKLVILAREAGYRVEQEDVKKNLFIPDSFFKGTLDDFWKNLPTLDKEFEEKRKLLETKQMKYRFVATMDNGDCSVGLQAVASTHPFYDLEGSNNIIMITTERYKEYPMIIKGYGAGASVTAAGVFADIISIANIR